MKNNTSENNTNNKMEFGVRVATHSILKQLNNGSHQKNLVVSPLSLHICLNLLSAGASGKTLDQLLRFLDSESVAQLNAKPSLFMDLATPGSRSMKKSRSDKGPIISLVNSIWVDHHYSLKHSYKKMADEIYKAESQSVDFTKVEKVAKEINAWAKKASKGRIDNLVSPESLAGAVIVLANALYFKGSWLQCFDASDTKDEYFHLLNGKRVRVPFMKKWSTRSYYKSFEDFKLVRMEYKTGEDDKRYSMYIFLPDQLDGLPKLVQKFHSDPGFFARDHELQHIKLGKLWLPKLKYEVVLNDLGENMKELGLDLPFDGKAEFMEIVDHDGVYVSKVIQKSYIEVNEEGTIATSITTTMLIGCPLQSLAPPPSINFVADHPFLFVIKEEVSGIVLFVGTALNPLASN